MRYACLMSSVNTISSLSQFYVFLFWIVNGQFSNRHNIQIIILSIDGVQEWVYSVKFDRSFGRGCDPYDLNFLHVNKWICYRIIRDICWKSIKTQLQLVCFIEILLILILTIVNLSIYIEFGYWNEANRWQKSFLLRFQLK